MTNQRERALGFIREALEGGLNPETLFDETYLLGPLREVPEFKAIVAEASARADSDAN